MQEVIAVAGLVVLFIGVARAIWVRWLADDAYHNRLDLLTNHRTSEIGQFVQSTRGGIWLVL